MRQKSSGKCFYFQVPKKGLRIYRNPHFLLARPLGLEPRTYGLEVYILVKMIEK